MVLWLGIFAFLSLFTSEYKAQELESVTHTTLDNIDWTELPGGRATATIHGDMQAGEHISYIRFPAGMRTAPHTHSSTYTGIMMKGVARHFEPELENESRWLSQGAFYHVPGGVPHISECAPESICVFAIHQHGPFDRSLAN